MILVHRTAISRRSNKLRLNYDILLRFDGSVLTYVLASKERGAEMKKRKPVLIVDESPDSLKATDLLRKRGIDFVEYDIRKFEESCCGDLPATKAPSVFAPEGVFKGLSGVEEYVSSAAATDKKANHSESESAYW